MEILEIIMMVIIGVLSVALTVLVLAQSGKEKGSGVIMGAGDTYIGTDRVKKTDKLLSKITTVLSILFVIAVVVMYVVVARG